MHLIRLFRFVINSIIHSIRIGKILIKRIFIHLLESIIQSNKLFIKKLSKLLLLFFFLKIAVSARAILILDDDDGQWWGTRSSNSFLTIKVLSLLSSSLCSLVSLVSLILHAGDWDVDDLPGGGHAGVVDEASTVGHQHRCHCPGADNHLFCQCQSSPPANSSNKRPGEKKDWNLAEAVHAQTKPLEC